MNQWNLWEVFIRGQHGLAHKHIGSVRAADAEMAITSARDVYTRRNEGISIWVIRSCDIFASNQSEKESMFEPAATKIYRHPTFYVVPADIEHL